jgi:hypothetical protein
MYYYFTVFVKGISRLDCILPFLTGGTKSHVGISFVRVVVYL